VLGHSIIDAARQDQNPTQDGLVKIDNERMLAHLGKAMLD